MPRTLHEVMEDQMHARWDVIEPEWDEQDFDTSVLAYVDELEDAA